MTSKVTWEEEGVLENILGTGADLAYYINRTHGVFHYVLGLDGHTMEERRLHASHPRDRRILDGVKQQWDYAQVAGQLDDTIAQFAFTWRGLRLLFPDLPEEPLTGE